MKWLVLGACGFIGNSVLRYLQLIGEEVCGTDIKMNPYVNALNIIYRSSDDPVLDRPLLEAIEPDVVLLATSHVSGASEAVMTDSYVQNTACVFRSAMASDRRPLLIILGSSAEYGNTDGTHLPSSIDSLHPITSYGRAKVAQYGCYLQYSSEYPSSNYVRLFNPIGPGTPETLFAGALRRRIMMKEDPIIIRDANYIRNWIDIRDVTRALHLFATSAAPASVYDLGAVSSARVGVLGALYADYYNASVVFSESPCDDWHLWRSHANAALFADIGWQQQYNLYESVRSHCVSES